MEASSGVVGDAPLARAEEIEEKDAAIRSIENIIEARFLLPKILYCISLSLCARRDLSPYFNEISLPYFLFISFKILAISPVGSEI